MLRAPITVRTQQGALPGSCAQHSQCLEALFAHIPGLKVALPATPQDAYNVLLSAIWHDDPVVVIEARGLYFGPREPVLLDGPIRPPGGATRRRSGEDVTLVTRGHDDTACPEGRHHACLTGIEADVIDLCWLNPLDLDAVLESVGRTSRLVVAHEANITGGFGAVVVARVAELGLHLLDAPVLRIGLPDARVPAAPPCSDSSFPLQSRYAHRSSSLFTHTSSSGAGLGGRM